MYCRSAILKLGLSTFWYIPNDIATHKYETTVGGLIPTQEYLNINQCGSFIPSNGMEHIQSTNGVVPQKTVPQNWIY